MVVESEEGFFWKRGEHVKCFFSEKVGRVKCERVLCFDLYKG